MRRHLLVVVAGLAAAMLVVTAAGATQAYPWRNHEPPHEFLFDNHIDTHQQSLAKNDMLQGFFYIAFTGSIDEASGLAVATHKNCAAGDANCEVGWVWHGAVWKAEYCGHPEGGGHPTWAVMGADEHRKRGYSHFHWLGQPEHAHDLEVGKTYDGYLLRLTAIDSFFFDHHGGFAITPGIEKASHFNLVDEC